MKTGGAIAVLLVCMMLVLPGQSRAEFYKYKDANGVTRFTDNLGDIPEDQRPKSTRYTQPEDSMTPEERAEAAEKRAAEKESRYKKSQGDRDEARQRRQDRNNARSKERKIQEFVALESRLEKEKRALDEEYASLKLEAGKMEQQAKGMRRPGAVRNYNARADQIKARMAAYEKRRQAFEADYRRFEKMKKDLMN